jgi:hypothetical protein
MPTGTGTLERHRSQRRLDAGRQRQARQPGRSIPRPEERDAQAALGQLVERVTPVVRSGGGEGAFGHEDEDARVPAVGRHVTAQHPAPGGGVLGEHHVSQGDLFPRAHPRRVERHQLRAVGPPITRQVGPEQRLPHLAHHAVDAEEAIGIRGGDQARAEQLDAGIGHRLEARAADGHRHHPARQGARPRKRRDGQVQAPRHDGQREPPTKRAQSEVSPPANRPSVVIAQLGTRAGLAR